MNDFCSCPACDRGEQAPHEYHLERRTPMRNLRRMAYRLGLVPEGETVPVQMLSVVRDQYLAALWAMGNAAPASPPAPPQQNEWLAEAERLADAYAQQSWINGCNGSAAGMTTGPESEARAALLSHLGKRSEPPGK